MENLKKIKTRTLNLVVCKNQKIFFNFISTVGNVERCRSFSKEGYMIRVTVKNLQPVKFKLKKIKISKKGPRAFFE